MTSINASSDEALWPQSMITVASLISNRLNRPGAMSRLAAKHSTRVAMVSGDTPRHQVAATAASVFST